MAPPQPPTLKLLLKVLLVIVAVPLLAMAPPLPLAPAKPAFELLLNVLLVTLSVPRPLKMAPPEPMKKTCGMKTVELSVKAQLLTLTVPEDTLLIPAPPPPLPPVDNRPLLIVRPEKVTARGAVTVKI